MKKLTGKNLEELAKVMPPLSEIEQRAIIGGDGRHRNDPFSSAGQGDVFNGHNSGGWNSNNYGDPISSAYGSSSVNLRSAWFALNHPIAVTLILISVLFFGACHRTFNDIVENAFEKCSDQNNSSDCVIDFSKIMNFEWDTMYFLSEGSHSPDNNKVLGFEFHAKGFDDSLGDKLVFMNNGKVVYYEKLPIIASDEEVEGSIFLIDENLKIYKRYPGYEDDSIVGIRFFKIDKSDATFKVRKEGKTFYLAKL